MKYIFLSLFISLSVFSLAQTPLDTTASTSHQKRMRMEKRSEKSPKDKDMVMPHSKIFGLKELNLNSEQEKTINEHQMVMQKQISQLMAELKIKRSELNLLEMNDKPDNKKIDKKIDEIGGLMSKMMKEQSAFKLKIRSILTPEQRITFDNRQENFNRRRGRM